MSFARLLYTLLYSLLLPIMLIRLWWRGKANPAYRQRWRERFGLANWQQTRGCLWVHSVSVGETLAAVPLVKSFQQQFPNRPILVTTTTPTGSAQVQRLYGDQVHHCYLPFDLPWLLTPFIKRLNPSALLIMETELWPNLLACCSKQRVPAILGNARLSERSARGYQRLSALTKPMLQQLTAIAAQYPADAERFIALGAESAKVQVIGSIKFDIEVDKSVVKEGQDLRQQWGAHRPVLALASSHPGEDERLLTMFVQLRRHIKELVLLLIPRHPERFDEVANLAQAVAVTHRRSHDAPASINTDIYVADSMGEMPLLLASADVVLMGGSLIPHGGHNPLESAALGIPTVIGPHHHNFAAMIDQMKAANAIEVVPEEPSALAVWLQQLFADQQRRQQLGNQGQTLIQQQRGAGEKLLRLVVRSCSDL